MNALQEMNIHMQKQDTAGIWNLAYYLKNRGTQPNTKFFSGCIEDTDITLPTTQKSGIRISRLFPLCLILKYHIRNIKLIDPHSKFQRRSMC